VTGDASSSWRQAKAQRFLAAAQRAVDASDWETAVSRAYYAAYHSVISVLETREGIVRANWSHNFRPFYARYTYLEGLRDDIDLLYRERLAADYRDEVLDDVRAAHALRIAASTCQRMLEVSGSG
jgi:uncharacterized protein (UPF0332 family)